MKGYGRQFCEAFNRNYAMIRKLYSSEQWERVWVSGDAWNHLMLWNPFPPQVQPLLELVAADMGFQYWNVGEPFRVDAAFVHADRRRLGSVPFPTVAAIEHEHNVNTIREEFAKLLHIRCALKAAITYASPGIVAGQELVRCQDKIRACANEMEESLERYIGEDPNAEYVCLLGVEAQPRWLVWHALAFSAGSKAANATWERLEPFLSV